MIHHVITGSGRLPIVFSHGFAREHSDRNAPPRAIKPSRSIFVVMVPALACQRNAACYMTLIHCVRADCGPPPSGFVMLQ